MKDMKEAHALGPDRVRAEELLARYAGLTEGERAELVMLFRKKLSAMDVAMIASADDLAPGYRQLKADHLERVTPRDFVNVALMVVALAGPVLAIAYWYS
ncbi:hypothetical protein [Croceicoccus bisphenolivorans]|uniref:hypothetical protein n=1 Tax=Croceicoccus bisphenolivorans TaxID=1783232 RepID=UPI00082E1FD2|nr:hypothetical protein [Croceicoccus bisphenolivorans]